MARVCSVPGCDHSPKFQSTGDSVGDYCGCHFWEDVDPERCSGLSDKMREALLWTFSMPSWWLVNGKPVWASFKSAMTHARIEADKTGTRATVQLEHAVRGRHRA